MLLQIHQHPQHCRATLHRPVVESAAEPDLTEYGDAAHCRAAQYTSVVAIAARYIG